VSQNLKHGKKEKRRRGNRRNKVNLNEMFALSLNFSSQKETKKARRKNEKKIDREKGKTRGEVDGF